MTFTCTRNKKAGSHKLLVSLSVHSWHLEKKERKIKRGKEGKEEWKGRRKERREEGRKEEKKKFPSIGKPNLRNRDTHPFRTQHNGLCVRLVQAGHEPSVCSCSPKGQLYPELH